DGKIFARVGVKEFENIFARAFDKFSGGKRSGIGRMRVAEDAFVKELVVLSNLRLGVDAAARVIEINVLPRVEAGIIALAEFVDFGGLFVSGVFLKGGFEFSGHSLLLMVYRHCEGFVLAMTSHFYR